MLISSSIRRLAGAAAAAALIARFSASIFAAEPLPAAPRFSVEHMDKTVSPGDDFFQYASGSWVKNNPVPSDKSRWSGFDELQERNWRLVRGLLEAAASGAESGAAARQVGDFFHSATDTNTLERLRFQPLQADFERIKALSSVEELLRLAARLHEQGLGVFFSASVGPDEKDSSVYTLNLGQGGLGLPDRDYYLTEGFAKQRAAYEAHIAKMFTLLGDSEADAKAAASKILSLETELAKASKTRTDLRDPLANYFKYRTADLAEKFPAAPLKAYLAEAGVGGIPDLVVRQPAFFTALEKLLKERPLDDWKTYLRWHVLDGAAPYLHSAAEAESFAFFGTTLRGQPAQEPRWQRAARVIDGSIGEALGQMYVAKYYPPAAKQRMEELIENLKVVFRERLEKLEWMTQPTRQKALAKFERFSRKIGHPEQFRDYSSIAIRRDDYLGNVRRATAFESRRQLARVGKPVDKNEWLMTPQTVNAYFNPLQNEIVFPAGILQPPFFDVEMDDAVNYGGIGMVIGHEITHGYDDEGRHYDADGNLNEWWTEADAKAFEERAQKLIDQYSGYEALPGLKVNGRLTLGENIADLGGASIAYEALQRALAKDPSKRKNIDGLTPEQRFFLSLSQVWRTNWREAELRRRITVDPHSPGQYRAIGAHVNLPEFYQAFGIKEGAPMWRAPELRARIW